ncbi:MAG TPA: sigma-54 dependent transcriptional regulator [Fibrobacteria bacterium]|nr:sigma-54 dependent transcriptional regulator [Fibrobacteria bacterium]
MLADDVSTLPAVPATAPAPTALWDSEAPSAIAVTAPRRSKNMPVRSSDHLHAPGSPMEEVFRMAAVLARREAPLLLHGESGTGKEVVAQWIHAHSPRAKGPFVAVNCAAITPSLVESELFGHCRGAFTNAWTDRPGHVRQAHGGTLFLDEIGDMPLGLQARFLRVLQEKMVRPVGGDSDIAVDFRLLCATHRDLFAEVRAGRFREDLYYRLRVLELHLPPLRQRPMDIPFLLRRFLEPLLGPESAMDAINTLPAAALTYHFPGNVRELRNLAERHAALREIGAGWEQSLHSCLCATEAVRESEPDYVRASRTSRLTAREVLAALEACGYHRGKAAAKLGVTRRTLQYHLARMKAGGKKEGQERKEA